MKKKTVRTLLLLFTLFFAVSTFSLTALAESGDTETDSQSGTTISQGGEVPPGTPYSSDADTDDQPTQSTSHPPHHHSSHSTSDDDGSRNNDNDDGGTQDHSHSSSSRSSSKADTDQSRSRSSSRNSTSATYVDPDNSVGSRKGTSRSATPNTYESQINQSASALGGSVTPDASSEDWNDLYNESASSPGTGSASSAAAGGAGAVTSGKSNGVSSMFIVGVVLLIAAACGIGAFVYLQFFSTKRRGGHGGRPGGGAGGGSDIRSDDGYNDSFSGEDTGPVVPPTPPVSQSSLEASQRAQAAVRAAEARAAAAAVAARREPKAPDDTIHDFTDINSSSDGIQHREEYEEFIERTRPPIVPSPAVKTEKPSRTVEQQDQDTIVIPDFTDKEAKKRAQQARTARMGSRGHQPPLTSNALPRNLRGRPTAAQVQHSSSAFARQTPTYQQHTASASTAPAVSSRQPAASSCPAPAVPKKKSSDDFDWDRFLNENRNG